MCLTISSTPSASMLKVFPFHLQMESELERFHKQNTNLELNIDELKLKLKATEKEMYQERQKVYIGCFFL